MASLSDLKANLLRSTGQEPSPIRADRARNTLLATAVSIAFGLGTFALLGGTHLGGRPLPFALGTVGGWVAIAALATALAYGRGKRMLGRRSLLLLGVTIAMPLGLLGWMALWNLLYPETMAGFPERIGVRCFFLTLWEAAIPLVALSLIRRERDPLHAAATGAARGAAAGALAGVLVDLWCPIAHPFHVALGHVIPLFVLGALGALLGRRLSGVSGDPRNGTAPPRRR